LFVDYCDCGVDIVGVGDFECGGSIYVPVGMGGDGDEVGFDCFEWHGDV